MHHLAVNLITEYTFQEVEVSFDGGWQKRGSGFNYNSLTGMYIT